MNLIVGLGNPGVQHKHTPHNIGFRVLDKIRRENNLPAFRDLKKFQALISEGTIDNKRVILAKPQTFMNKSGEAVKKIIKYFKLKTGDLIVAHDDIDIPLGKIRIVKNRGAAGHKGVESIIEEIGSKDFTRIRIGIQPKTGKPENLEKFVLQKFSREEETILKNILKEAADSITNSKKLLCLKSKL